MERRVSFLKLTSTVREWSRLTGGRYRKQTLETSSEVDNAIFWRKERHELQLIETERVILPLATFVGLYSLDMRRFSPCSLTYIHVKSLTRLPSKRLIEVCIARST